MRLGTVSKGTRIVVLALASLLLVGLFALPAFAAGQHNQFIHTNEYFEKGDSKLPDCSSGTFEATGQVVADGWSRTCARGFGKAGIVTGTTQLHDGDDLTVHWKVHCVFDGNDRFRHFDCKGQWWVDGPNWTGRGNTRAVLDFSKGPYGQVEFTHNGDLTAA
jgi:hypothetical protein